MNKYLNIRTITLFSVVKQIFAYVIRQSPSVSPCVSEIRGACRTHMRKRQTWWHKYTYAGNNVRVTVNYLFLYVAYGPSCVNLQSKQWRKQEQCSIIIQLIWFRTHSFTFSKIANYAYFKMRANEIQGFCKQTRLQHNIHKMRKKQRQNRTTDLNITHIYVSIRLSEINVKLIRITIDWMPVAG